MHLLSPPPCQRPDEDSPAHRNGKDSEHALGPREDQHIDSHAYIHIPISSKDPSKTLWAEDSLVICILHRSRAHGLEIKDAIFLGCRSANQASGEDRLADIGIGTEDLMHAEMLEE